MKKAVSLALALRVIARSNKKLQNKTWSVPYWSLIGPHKWVVEERKIYRVSIATLDGDVQTIDVTSSHPFYVKGKGWVDTIDLVAGDLFEDDEGKSLEVLSIVDLNKRDTAYNFTVADFHTYYVTEQNVLVHNCNKRYTRKGFETRGQAKKKALSLGYSPVGPPNAGKAPIFYNKNAPKAVRYISMDIDKHSAGGFKGEPTYNDVLMRTGKSATYDTELNHIGK